MSHQMKAAEGSSLLDHPWPPMTVADLSRKRFGQRTLPALARYLDVTDEHSERARSSLSTSNRGTAQRYEDMLEI